MSSRLKALGPFLAPVKPLRLPAGGGSIGRSAGSPPSRFDLRWPFGVSSRGRFRGAMMQRYRISQEVCQQMGARSTDFPVEIVMKRYLVQVVMSHAQGYGRTSTQTTARLSKEKDSYPEYADGNEDVYWRSLR